MASDSKSVASNHAAAAMPPSLPTPFSMKNPSLICHFNSLMQALVGCPAIAEVVQKHRGYFDKTGTGRAFCDFYDTIADGKPMDHASSRLLAALIADLRQRRPWTAFGNSQESASEGLILLLDMISHEQAKPKTPADAKTAAGETPADAKTAAGETPAGAKTAAVETPADAKTAAGETPADAKTADAKTAAGETPANAPPPRLISPLSLLFEHRYRCFLICIKCREVVSKQDDSALQFMLDGNPPDLAKALMKYTQPLEGSRCPTCKSAELVRHYRLVRAPQILVCCFNIYRARPLRDIPRGFEFESSTGEPLCYNGHAQVTHQGTTWGGHYTAVALRETAKGPAFFKFDDGAPPAPADWAEESTDVYMAIYCRD